MTEAFSSDTRHSPLEPVTVRAPAKVNLYLHVTGRRPDGFHLLDSLVVFTSFGDTVSVAPARAGTGLKFFVDGPFADQAPCDDDNLVLRAAHALMPFVSENDGPARVPDVTLRLTKRLPVAAGIGGGSSDAAATLRGLDRFWGLGIDAAALAEIGLGLGADVPMCLHRSPVMVGGIGEHLTPAPRLPRVSLVLVNPGVPLATPAVFRTFDGVFSTPAPLPDCVRGFGGLTSILRQRHNDLSKPAIATVPEIQGILDVLSSQDGCALSRMSGSGPTCFGLFANDQQAAIARDAIQAARPHWWVESMSLFSGAYVS